MHDMDFIDISNNSEKAPIFLLFDVKNTTLLKEYQYCRVNIPGKDAEVKQFEEEFEGCSCYGTQTCVNNIHCECHSRFSTPYDGQRRLRSDNSGLSMTPIYECNKNCACTHDCIRRNVQYGVQFPLCVFQTNGRGMGVKTSQRIEKGTFVCEYAGEIISIREAKRRASEQTIEDMNYILVVNEHYGGNRITTCVDPRFVGNVGRFLNHSCDPNLHMVPVRVHNAVPHFCLFAKTDIEPGCELCYSYAGSGVDQIVTDTDISPQRKPCLCGSGKCSGVLPFDASLYD